MAGAPSFLDPGALARVQKLANRWAYKPEPVPVLTPNRDPLKDRALTLRQTSDAIYAAECAEFEAGLLPKPPKHLSGEYIRQIENTALRKLKAALDQNGDTLEDLIRFI